MEECPKEGIEGKVFWDCLAKFTIRIVMKGSTARRIHIRIMMREAFLKRKVFMMIFYDSLAKHTIRIVMTGKPTNMISDYNCAEGEKSAQMKVLKTMAFSLTFFNCSAKNTMKIIMIRQ